jgi:ankyrin repeat protein
VNAANCKGHTALYAAMASTSDQHLSDEVVDESKARVAALLLNAKADIDRSDNSEKHSGETALFRAARLCHHRCIELLIRAGANAKVTNKVSGENIFHVYRKNAHLCLQLLADAGACELINQAKHDGNTALHHVVKRSVTGKSVALLLQNRADPTISNHVGLTPLHIACQFDRHVSVNILLSHGVDINLPTSKMKLGSDMLLGKKQPPSSKTLTDALALSSVLHCQHKIFSDSPLHIACRSGSNDSVRALLQFSKAPNALALNTDNMLPIDESRNLDPATLRLLLELMSQQSSEVQKLQLCSTGGVASDHKLFEENLDFIFKRFLRLEELTIDTCALRSLPPSIKMLTRLRCISVLNCSCLRSLPDEIGSMDQLQRIVIKNCNFLEFPPYKMCSSSKSTQRIKTFLKESSGSTPLRSVKVLFLGNGRSGKTSVLNMLARSPLRPGDKGPDSTRGITGYFKLFCGAAICRALTLTPSGCAFRQVEAWLHLPQFQRRAQPHVLGFRWSARVSCPSTPSLPALTPHQVQRGARVFHVQPPGCLCDCFQRDGGKELFAAAGQTISAKQPL